VPAWLYGVAISDEEIEQLLARLRARRTPESLWAAGTFTREARRDAHAETALIARQAILQELREWADLDVAAPRLATVRDRLDKLHAAA
jgi:hypothetical protein